MLHTPVLVLNRSYLPVQVTTVRRAFRMLYGGIAKALDHQYRTFDFDTWLGLDPVLDEEAIGIVQGLVRIPRVIVLIAFERFIRKTVRFSRNHVFLRDNFTCQYCGKRLPRSQLNLDHVVPRARGGKTSWENVVTSCFACNHRKGESLLAQTSMRLLREPYRPQVLPFVDGAKHHHFYEQWLPFIQAVNLTSWQHS